jgi:hypothetical protein
VRRPDDGFGVTLIDGGVDRAAGVYVSRLSLLDGNGNTTASTSAVDEVLAH